jgi:hypothetical protein
MYLQKKMYISIKVCINPLSRIHNTRYISAYFGLDSREGECLEYYIIIKVGKLANIIDDV